MALEPSPTAAANRFIEPARSELHSTNAMYIMKACLEKHISVFREKHGREWDNQGKTSFCSYAIAMFTPPYP